MKRKVYAVIRHSYSGVVPTEYVNRSSTPVMCVYGSYKSACAYIYSIYSGYGAFLDNDEDTFRDYSDGSLKIYHAKKLLCEFFVQTLELQ